MQSITGLYLFPTMSHYPDGQVNITGKQTPGIYQGAFTYNHAISKQATNTNFCNYLSIDLNEFVDISTNTYDGRFGAFNSIIVNGFIQSRANLSTTDVIRFTQKFVTDYAYSNNTDADIFGYNPNLNSFTFSWMNNLASSTAGDGWSPSDTMVNWKNGSDCVNGTYWDPNERTVVDWNCGYPGYTLSGQTGARGGVDLSNSLIPNSGLKYAFTEASNIAGLPSVSSRAWIMRSPGFNLTTLMSDTSNDATLKFYVHGYSSTSTQSGLSIFIDDAATSNTFASTLLYTIGNSSQSPNLVYNQTAFSSPYQLVEISLNNYRTINSDHYIYFVAQGATTFRSDITVDQMTIAESGGGLNFESDFVEYQSLADNTNTPSFLSLVPSVTVDNTSGQFDFANPIVNFNLAFGNNSDGSTIDPYIKGTYLLM